MNEIVEGYRAFPETIQHPRKATVLSSVQFQSLEKSQMQSAGSVCPGHLGTVAWYVSDPRKYIVDVHLEPDRHVYVESICTITPSFGMDAVDGMFVQDIEEFVLAQNLGFETSRLVVYGDEPDIPVTDYLNDRGIMGEIVDDDSSNQRRKPWWKFW